MLAAAAIILGLVWFTYASNHEPRYEGRSLSEWLRLHEQEVTTRQRHFTGKPADAVRHIGTNGLPFLVKWMQEYRMLSPWKVTLRNYAADLGPPAGEIWAQTVAKRERRAHLAFSGFEILGETVAPAIPDLVRVANQGKSGSSPLAIGALAHLGKDALSPLLALMTNSAFPFRNEAMMSVGTMHYLGTNAHPAVVLLIQSLSDPHLAPSAANVLGMLRLESDITVPALAECTHSPQKLLRGYAAISLGKFGASARAAVPHITNLLVDTDDSVRIAATNTLALITADATPP